MQRSIVNKEKIDVVVLTKQMSGLKLIMTLTILKTNSTASVLEINLLTTISGLNVTNVGIINQFKHSRMSTVWMRMVSIKYDRIYSVLEF